jgi:hypothetical protein
MATRIESDQIGIGLEVANIARIGSLKFVEVPRTVNDS